MPKFLDENGLAVVKTNLDKTYVNQEVVAPEYSATATYNVGDIVMHDNKLYKCTTAIATAEAWDATHWTLINVAELNSDIVTITATGVQSDEMAAKIENAKALYFSYPAGDVYRLYTKLQETSTIIDFICQDQGTNLDTRYLLRYTKSTKTLESSATSPSHVAAIGGKYGNVSINSSLQTTGTTISGTLGLSGKLPYIDDASQISGPNTSGFLTIVVLSAEPATRYDGYLYIITASAA